SLNVRVIIPHPTNRIPHPTNRAVGFAPPQGCRRHWIPIFLSVQVTNKPVGIHSSHVEIGLRVYRLRCSFLFDGLVSGISNHSRTTAVRAAAAMPRNPATLPRLTATRPESVVLSEAPTPDIVPTNPCARLNRPVPVVRSATTSAVSTPSIVPLTPSSIWAAMRIIGLVVQANTSARIGNAANPTSSSVRRPHVFAVRPAHGAISATITCGTMINAETISEDKASLLYASASPASGSIDALAIWNKNKQPANVSRLRFFQRLRRGARGGALAPW